MSISPLLATKVQRVRFGATPPRANRLFPHFPVGWMKRTEISGVGFGLRSTQPTDGIFRFGENIVGSTGFSCGLLIANIPELSYIQNRNLSHFFFGRPSLPSAVLGNEDSPFPIPHSPEK